MGTMMRRLPKGGNATLQNTNVQALLIADALAAARPSDLLKYEKQLVECYEKNEQMLGMSGPVFEKLAFDEVGMRIKVFNKILFLMKRLFLRFKPLYMYMYINQLLNLKYIFILNIAVRCGY